MSRLIVPAVIALLVTTSACRRDQGPPRDARAEAAASVAQRMQGRWLLQGFQPTGQIDFAMQQLLNAQIGQLVLDVNGMNMFIRGPGIAVPRTYRVDEAYAEHFQMMVFDTYGVGFRASGDFAGSQLVLTGMDAPWVGRATLVRVP